MSIVPLVLGFVSAPVVASLVEYLAHRAMHRGWLLARRHARHHRTPQGQGVLPEMIDYAGASLPLMPMGFVFGVAAGVGFVGGALVYVFFAAWAHQMHHERPELVFWMRTPVHRVHHDRQLKRANFGLVTDFWDRVFGTYVPLAADAPPRPRGWRELFRVDWGFDARVRSPWRSASASARERSA